MKKSFMVVLSFAFIVFISSCRNNANSNSTTDVTEQEPEPMEMEVQEPQIEMVSKLTEEEAMEVETKGPEEALNENGEVIEEDTPVEVVE